MNTPAISVRTARYQLAVALRDLDPPRSGEAVDQLTQAVDEPGADPPTWRLYQAAGQAMQGVDPSEALKLYLRSLREPDAPDDVAHEAREWVSTQRTGTLRPTDRAIRKLLVPSATPVRRLLGARLLWEVARNPEDIEEAVAVLSEIDPSDARISGPVQELEVRCLIELGRFADAENALDESSRPHPLDTVARAFLRSRLAFEERDFDAALRHLRDCPDTPDTEVLRNLALVGAERAEEVVWTEPEVSDGTIPDVWLSRAVAALEANAYDQARQAVSWAERDLPESLSVQLLRAQSLLEPSSSEDALAPGLAALEVAVRGVQNRDGRAPFWRGRQKTVRRSPRFYYVLCEYSALDGSLTVEDIRSVDQRTTTYFQDGRLAELESARYDEASEEWADALDRAVVAYQSARNPARAADLAGVVFASCPTPTRGIAFGWAVYEAAFAAQASPESAAAVRATLDAAVVATRRALSDPTSDRTEAIQLMAALQAKRLEMAERDTVVLGIEATVWGLANAILAVEDVTANLSASWLLRQSFDVPAASVELAEYAATLGPESAMVLEARLLSRIQMFGWDAEVEQLKQNLIDMWELDTQQEGAAVDDWIATVRLNVAFQSGDADQIVRELDGAEGADQGLIALRAIAAVTALGWSGARAYITDARERLRGLTDVRKVLSAYLAALDGDYEAALDELSAALAEGTVRQTSFDDDVAVFRYLRDGDRRPVAELVAERLELAATGEDVRWWQNFVYRWLADVRGESPRPPSELLARIDARLDELWTNPEPWPVTLSRVDEGVGYLATVWQAAAARDPERMLAAVAARPEGMALGLLATVVDHVISKATSFVGSHLLDVAVAGIAAGRRPVDVPFAQAVTLGVPAALAAALVGVAGPTPSLAGLDRTLCAEALANSADEHCLDPDSVWRVLDAVEALPPAFLSWIGDAARASLMALLERRLGLLDVPEPRGQWIMAVALGEAFIPEDTGPDWILFAEYLPQMRDRVLADTGFEMPGLLFRGDPDGRADVVEVLLDEIVQATTTVPVDGTLVCRPPSDEEALLRDPLSGDPVRHVPDGDPLPEGEAWLPLEFALRHVEHFIREHFSRMVTTLTIWRMAEAAGPEWVHQIDDPRVFRAWLAALRRDVTIGGLRTPAERAAALAKLAALAVSAA